MEWSVIVGGSALIGVLVAWQVPRRPRLLAAAVPWFSLLAWLLYYEYFVPYYGGGASMWPVAQLVGGTVAAVVGWVSCIVAQRLWFRARPHTV